MSNELITRPVDAELIVPAGTDVVSSNPRGYTPITNTSRDGDFVHKGQTMSGSVGFRNVSRLWYDKCITIETGLEQMAEQRKEREDLTVPVSTVGFKSDDKGVTIQIGDREFRPTPYALSKICTWFHTPQTVASYYMNPPNNGKYNRDSLDYDVIAYALENGIRRVSPEKELLFRTYKDGTLRGVMSDIYSIVDNEWYLLCLQQMIPGAMLSHWKGDADTIYGNILIPDTIRVESDSEYGGMLSISNCEIGRRLISQIASTFRAICMNGNIWGSSKGQRFTQRHKGVILEDLAAEIKDNLMLQIPLTTQGIDLLLTTRSWKINTRMVNIFAQIGKSAGIPVSIMNAVCVEYQNQGAEKTAFACIDALTRVSQRQTNDLWVSMDTLAGQLVQPRAWDNLQTVAKTLDDETVAKYLVG